jgi:biotin transport system ATP-binding protein
MRENAQIIEVKNLHHLFSDGTHALRGIDFAADAGEFILCAGRNGSGKSVFMRHLNALYLPTEGSVFIEGRDTRRYRSRARQVVGMVFQDADSQIVGSTVEKDVRFGPENLKLPPEEIENRTREALEAMELTKLASHRPHQLSGGEKRRLALAGALAMRPRALILDEPFSNLDYPGVQSLLRHILALHDRGHTILLVTHEVEKAAAHVGRIVVFEEGRIVEDGPVREVLPRIGRYGLRPVASEKEKGQGNSWLESLSWLK